MNGLSERFALASRWTDDTLTNPPHLPANTSPDGPRGPEMCCAYRDLESLFVQAR